jgi:hypothetical protein
MLTNPTESDARDQAIKAMIADPKARQHEIVAETELNIDYSGSPIVSGDPHSYLKAGQRLPELISVQRTDGQPCRLYEVAHRAGHTLILLAGPAADASALADLHATLQGVAANSPLFEAAVGFGSNRDLPARIGYLEPAAANLLGVEGLTLLAMRPDGYIGLRADRDQLGALQHYRGLVLAGHP